MARLKHEDGTVVNDLDAIQEALAPLAALVDEFRSALADLDHAIAEDLVDLALATGRQLAGDALREEPAEILNLVRTLIHEEPALNGKTRLWLHPDDLALVEQELHAEFHAAGWKLHPDDQLSRGGCRVTSPSGELRSVALHTRSAPSWPPVTSRVPSAEMATERMAPLCAPSATAPWAQASGTPPPRAPR